jgi:hypothetical protein
MASGYASVIETHQRLAEAALLRLQASVRDALARAGLSGPGALAEIGLLAPEELKEFYADLTGGEHMERYDEFQAALAACMVPAKRARLAFAAAPPEAVCLLAEERRSPPPPSPSPAAPPARPAAQPPRWPTRLRRDLALSANPEAVADAEEKHRRRWLDQFIEVLRATDLPASRLAVEALDPDAFLRRCAGGSRVGTLRIRVRTWQKVERWLAAAGVSCFPQGETGVTSFLSYLELRAQEPCARTVPSTLLTTLSFFENCGGLPPADRVSAHPVVLRTVKDIEVSLDSGKGHLRRKAAQFPVMVVIALELVVIDADHAAYKRAYAWVTLIRIWAALRFDDSVHVRPSELTWSEKTGLSFYIRRSKTTGPGKRISVLTAHVGPEAFLVCQHWLGTGFALFKELGGLPRDYLLPMPMSDLSGFKRAPVRYADELVLLKAMLGELRCPHVGAEGVWKLGDEKLLPPELASFWSAHSHRAVLTSWGACLRLSRDVMDNLGRWASTGSCEYVRTTRALIVGAQSQIAAAVRAGKSAATFDGEDDLIADILKYMYEHGVDAVRVNRALEDLCYFGKSHSPGEPAGLSTPPAAPAVEAARSDAETEVVSPTAREASGAPGDAAQEDDDADIEYDHIISITGRTQARCLHMADGCYRARGLTFVQYEVHSGAVDPRLYDSVCKSCWKCTALYKVPSITASSDETSSSSSSSSA